MFRKAGVPYPLTTPMPLGTVPFLAGPVGFPPPQHAPVRPYYGGGAVRRTLPPAPPVAVLDIEIRKVMAANMESELARIGDLLRRFPIVVVDTEYPGTVHRPPDGKHESEITAEEWYALVKANVDNLPLLQLGLTLCDEQGRLPRGLSAATGNVVELAWEFSFRDFDLRAGDPHVPESIEFLRSQGLHLDLVRAHGVSFAAFREKLLGVLPPAAALRQTLTWVAFGGAYDFTYLFKILAGGEALPKSREGFTVRLREILGGGRVFDAKYMVENCGRGDLRGVGLKRVAAILGVPRQVREAPRLAGPKSLTTCRIFALIRRRIGNAAARHEGFIDRL